MTGPATAADQPDRIGPFVIERRIGRGAFGAVYRAVHAETQRTVALKVLHRSDLSPQTVRRLDAEAEALRTLEDDAFPWFPRVVEAGRHDGLPWLAMELVAGGRIDAFCDERALPLAERVRLFRLVCLALQRAHQLGILHLDLKPAHILVHDDADPRGGPAPRIVDFGLARGVDRSLVLDESTGGAVLGTPGFMSPELLAHGKVDGRADVYALGVVLYWLLAGCKPREDARHDGHRADELLPRPDLRYQQVLRAEPADGARIAAQRGETPSGLCRALRGDLGTLVMRALEPEPRRRYQDPGEFALDLQRWLEHRPIPGRNEWFYRARLFVRRNRTAVGVGLGALAAAIAVIALLGANLVQAQENERLAAERRKAVAAALFAGGEAAAQRGRWQAALDLYARAEDAGHGDRVALGIRRVEALEASFQTGRAKQTLAAVQALPEAEAFRARLLLLQADLGVARMETPDVGLDLVRQARDLAGAQPGALPPAEAEYAAALLAGRPREALDCLRRARTHDASHHRVNLAYVLTLLALGDVEGVRSFAALFLALNPDDEECHYLSVMMLALGRDPVPVRDALATIGLAFGPEARATAEEIAETMPLIGWANQRIREQLCDTSQGVGGALVTFLGLSGKVVRLQRAIEERRAERAAQGRFEALVRLPPAVARTYRPLLELAKQRPFRPQAIAAALDDLEPGQADSGLFFFHAMGLVFVDQPLAALDRLGPALATPSLFFERSTVLLFGCVLGAKTFLEWKGEPVAAGKARLRRQLRPWFLEAADRDDWQPLEMVAVYECAMACEEAPIAVAMAHRWYAKAPQEVRIRIALAEALVIEGAVDGADRLLAEIEAGRERLSEPAKVRLADVRKMIAMVRKE